MRSNVASDMSWSMDAFVRLAWPKLQEWCNGGRLVPVESAAEEAVSHLLDVNAGIDYLHEKGHRVRGVAARVQKIPPDKSPYDTFTIRWTRPSGEDTEYVKRRESVLRPDKGILFPYMTVQAYVSDEKPPQRLLSLGMVVTRHLYEFVDDLGEAAFDIKPNTDGSSEFLVVGWGKAADNGLPMMRWPKQTNTAATVRG